MLNMTDFFSLCINMDTIIGAFCSNEEPQPIILHQILLNFVAIINNPDWLRWTESVDSMPLLRWYCYSYSFLECIFNCFADFATDFGNGNIMSESHPITELNTKALVWALPVMKGILNEDVHVKLHKSTRENYTCKILHVLCYTYIYIHTLDSMTGTSVAMVAACDVAA